MDVGEGVCRIEAFIRQRGDNSSNPSYPVNLIGRTRLHREAAKGAQIIQVKRRRYMGAAIKNKFILGTIERGHFDLNQVGLPGSRAGRQRNSQGQAEVARP